MTTPDGDMMRNPETASEWDPAAGAARTDSLRALLDPSIAPLFWRSERAGTVSAWWRHVPFGQWLVLQARPRVLVELGTQAGVSYCAFCEAVLQGSLATRCHAVDTWYGDEHSGAYGPEVYEELRRYHDARFAGFSTLLRCSFDEALGAIADNSVDLLHLDGLHTYEAVSHDFQSWLPKLSQSAIVLFHDTNERRDGYGVWRLWEELARRYPSFEFLHGHGLGVLAVGERPPTPVAALCALSDPAAIASLRKRFAAAGERLAIETELRRDNQDARQQIDAAAATAAQARGAFEQERAVALAQLEQARAEAQRAMAARQVAETRTHRAEAEIEPAARSALLAQQRAKRAEAAAAEAAAQAATVTGSTVWRASQPLRAVLERSPTIIRRTARRLLRAAWRTATFRRRIRERRRLRQQLRAITTSALFDREWYLAQYPDVAAAGLDPALHYLTRGGAERRLPGPGFDTGWYLDTYPDVAAAGVNPLLHYVESGRAEGRQTQYVDPYSRWVQEYDTLSDADRTAMRAHIETLGWHPTFSVLVPVYNTNEDHLREMIESVRQQIYPHWELCIADDGSTDPRVKKVLEDCRQHDPRIKVHYRPSNGHISAASNSALGLATGDFVALLDHDDVLAPHALYMVAHAANTHREADVFYSDEDKLNAEGNRTDPYFKPDWNQELFYGQNFVNHLGVYRTASVRAAGGFRLGFEGSQDYDLTLRLVAATRGPVVHIPCVLYHWRIFPGAATHSSTQIASATAAARRAIKEHLESRGERATVTAAATGHYHRVVREEPDEWPKVSVIIPTRDHAEMLAECITGLLERTNYPDLEIIIADNESIAAKTEAFFAQVAARGVRILPSPGPFNFSRINNAAAREATGDILLFLNNDVTVIDPGWLKEMIVHAARPGIGAVGARLLYPDGTIQHAGVVLGIGGVAGHIHCHAAADDPGYFGRLVLTQDISCVTAACMAVPKAVFAQVGGFDEENLAVAFNDVDLCIRIREAGYRIIWTPYAELVHAESKSRGSDLRPSRTERFHREGSYVRQRWGRLLLEDPFFNPNLSLDSIRPEPAFPPRSRKPWVSNGRRPRSTSQGMGQPDRVAAVSRKDVLLAGVDRSSRVVEIGPSYSPLAAKSDGWNTKTVDHATRREIVEKYRGQPGVDVDRIEEVDFIWTSGSVADAVPTELHGTFDTLIASHVIEHTTDLVGFLEAASTLLTPDGAVILAVPDRRYCFDYFRPLTTTGDVLDAHEARRSRHTRRNLFNYLAYSVKNGGIGAWGQAPIREQFEFYHSLAAARELFATASDAPESPYHDAHAWQFTPASFELLLLELARLGEIDWQVEWITAPSGCEFYVRLRRGGHAAAATLTIAELDAQRLTLLKRALLESRDQIDFLVAADR